ncbi:hypothetical protein [Chryseobacterium indologenes]|uniref:hypothetical protein n=1 Tax=Chryseobacterium indologenes TaxID=253 RepID=UPI00124B5CDA|nr:hypothetical protein [Chryseobacterium indologenes]
MTNKEFKEQFAPAFSQQMKQVGYTGAGFRYAMETQIFVFVFELEVNKHKQINLFFGIQPKAITQMGNFMTHNFKKIAPQSCELTIQLIRSLKEPFWKVGADRKENEKEAYDVFAFIQTNVLPIITKYVNNPDLLDKIEPSDLSDKNIMHQKLYGMHPAGMPSRTAWMLAMYHESKDLARAIAFARYGLENLGTPTVKITPEIQKMLDEGLVAGSVFGNDPNESTFFGIADLKRIDKK